MRITACITYIIGIKIIKRDSRNRIRLISMKRGIQAKRVKVTVTNN
jgi:hypothetical protein